MRRELYDVSKNWTQNFFVILMSYVPCIMFKNTNLLIQLLCTTLCILFHTLIPTPTRSPEDGISRCQNMLEWKLVCYLVYTV